MTTSAEIPFEVFGLALESARGTAVTPPTSYLPFAGTITPIREKYRPAESRGTLAANYRSKTVRARSEWSGSGGLDPNYAPMIFNLVVKAVASPSTPTNGVKTRLWTFAPTMTSDDLKTATVYAGDPNVQLFQSDYALAEELTISADASGTDAATWEIKGGAHFPARVGATVFPAQTIGSLVMPSAMQLWIDTGATAIGTTEVTGRFISTDWTIPTGVSYKWFAVGPAGGLNFSKIGRAKRAATAKIVVEFNSDSIGASKEYLTWEADTDVKMRIRLNGTLIESVTPDYYNYVQLDIYGPLDAFAWGSVADSNRTMELTVTSQYNSGAACDFALYAQNEITALA